MNDMDAVGVVFTRFEELRDSLQHLANGAEEDLNRLVEQIREVQNQVIGTHFVVNAPVKRVIMEALRSYTPEVELGMVDPVNLADLLEDKVLWVVGS
ncbi:MAG: hypothetical protein LBV06_07060 [Propionibacteriaceae bacterium]|jgi:hypothetical protein|nr:hypothetical protein [Propionibacteriaceae bacterium]